ncbi:MAG: hypothetical protein V4484_18480 [Pseudomonadota bacterium]
MTTPTDKPAPTKRAIRRAEKVANPFLDPETHARMRDYTEREAAVSKELKAIAERGAGKRCPDPRSSPSLLALRPIVKKGVTLEEMFNRIAAGTEKGLWESWMTVFGFELQSVNYTGTPRNAHLVLDLGLDSKAGMIFSRLGVTNWRSMAAEDCFELKVQKATESSLFTAFAVFHLDPAK